MRGGPSGSDHHYYKIVGAPYYKVGAILIYPGRLILVLPNAPEHGTKIGTFFLTLCQMAQWHQLLHYLQKVGMERKDSLQSIFRKGFSSSVDSRGRNRVRISGLFHPQAASSFTRRHSQSQEVERVPNNQQEWFGDSEEPSDAETVDLDEDSESEEEEDVTDDDVPLEEGAKSLLAESSKELRSPKSKDLGLQQMQPTQMPQMLHGESMTLPGVLPTISTSTPDQKSDGIPPIITQTLCRTCLLRLQRYLRSATISASSQTTLGDFSMFHSLTSSNLSNGLPTTASDELGSTSCLEWLQGIPAHRGLRLLNGSREVI